jgi:serine/threonine protein kinase
MTASARSPSIPVSDEARYQIERKLGEGAAGAVYLARDRETGELLARKKLFRMDAKSVLRLKREFRALQAISHPHIVKLYDMGRSGAAAEQRMHEMGVVDVAADTRAHYPELCGAS